MMLIALNLPFAPKDQVIDNTKKMWVAAFRESGMITYQHDIERLKIAFKIGLSSFDSFPSPKAVIDKMPRRDLSQCNIVNAIEHHRDDGAAISIKFANASVDDCKRAMEKFFRIKRSF